jgi:hypothetical protein
MFDSSRINDLVPLARSGGRYEVRRRGVDEVSQEWLTVDSS